MARILDQPSCSSLSSSAAYSSTFSSLGDSNNRSSLAWGSSRSSRRCSLETSSSSSPLSNLTCGRRKQIKRRDKADHFVPASLLMENRGSSKESNGVAVTIYRENLASALEEGRFCEEELLGRKRRVGDDVSTRPAEALETQRRTSPAAAEAVVEGREENADVVWLEMRAEARRDSDSEPALASYLYSTILAHSSLERALAFHLGNKLSSATFLSTQLMSVFIDTIMEDQTIRDSIRLDAIAVKERDPACVSYAHCLLNFKGFLALQAHRVAHRLWMQGRQSLALAMQSRVSEVFHVDIHPAAAIGSGILFDHATGVVIGETAVIGNNVSILHHVTLGGTGSVVGDRHPKIGDGVLIGAGATILGLIRIGEGAKIGAGSVVLTDIPPRTTAVGNPARLLGGKDAPRKSKDIPSETMDHTSFMSHWSDYVI